MWGHFLGPLLAGYFVINYAPRFRYYHAYLDQQRVLFHSAAAGAVAFVLTEFAILVINFFLGSTDAWMKSLGMPTFTLASISATLLLLSYLLASRLKQRCRTKPANEILHPRLERAIRDIGLELDVFLLDAFKSEQSILVTLDNGKFYVAQVNSTPTPRETRYIQLLPLLSGYRDDRKELVFTSSYIPLFERHGADKFRLVVELKDITSFSTWDSTIYDEHFRRQLDPV